ncbi:transcriptional repressor [Pleurocapsales cyanobacterium LEGE 10410]|nr:transcriptional repressor [Pleurocapsales cyanobacterium LEGE 10410]
MKAQRTRSQERIMTVLQSLKRSISAQDLYIELRNRKQDMGLATVYRSLEALKIQGEVQVRTLANGEAVYSYIESDRHHLTCVNCGTSIQIDECPVHDLEKQLEKSHTFKVYYHTLEFFGLCQKCH